jgi:hypothetical protein
VTCATATCAHPTQDEFWYSGSTVTVFAGGRSCVPAFAQHGESV